MKRFNNQYLPHFASFRAFTRTDLLATMAVIGLLGIIQWSALGDAQNDPKRIICQNNLRQLTLAWTLFTEDHEGRLPGNLDGAGVMNLANSNRTWVLGWLDLNATGQPAGANTNKEFLTKYSRLAPYTGGMAEIFHCPEDYSLSPSSWLSPGQPRVRSVSMNSWLAGLDRQNNILGSASSLSFNLVTRMDEIVDLSPAHQNVFIEERADSINDGSLQVSMYGWPDSERSYWIVDYPADRHSRGANLSFADNHVEYWHWEDPRTSPPHDPGQEMRLNVSSPSNPDVRRLQEVSSRPVTTN